MGLRVRFEAPVGTRVAHGVEVPDRDMYPDVVVLAARFEQQNFMASICAQPIRHDTACTAGAYDNVVIFSEVFDCISHSHGLPSPRIAIHSTGLTPSPSSKKGLNEGPVGPLAMREDGGPLLKEGVHPLPLAFGGEGCLKQAP